MAEPEERFEEVYDELRDELEELCHEKRYNDLRKRFLDMNPADIAWLFDDMPEDHLPVMFRLLSKEVAADVFINLESDSQEMLIKGFSNSELEAILDEMFLDDTIDVIEEMPANVVKRILKYSDPETRREINKSRRFPCLIMSLLKKDLISNIYCFNYVTGLNFGFTHLLCSKINLLTQVYGERKYSVLLQAPSKKYGWLMLKRTKFPRWFSGRHF